MTATLYEFWARSVPAGVGVISTRNTMEFVLPIAVTCAVLPPACTAGVLGIQAVGCKVPPAPALHALHWFLLLLRWVDYVTADGNSVLD